MLAKNAHEKAFSPYCEGGTDCSSCINEVSETDTSFDFAIDTATITLIYISINLNNH